MKVPHWENDPEAWDRVVLGSSFLPGIWDVDFTLKRAIDKKKGKGKDGARILDHGYWPTEMTLTGRFISAADWQAMQDIIGEIHPKRQGGERAPLAIEHPKTLFAGIQHVYVTEISSPTIDNGILTLKIKCLQWQPKAKKVAKGSDTPLSNTGISIADNGPPALENFPGYAGPFE